MFFKNKIKWCYGSSTKSSLYFRNKLLLSGKQNLKKLWFKGYVMHEIVKVEFLNVYKIMGSFF